MEQILFSSQELDLNFSLSDHSISSDEELIPISEPQISGRLTKSYGNDSEKVTNDKCCPQTSKYFMSTKNQQNSEKIDMNEINVKTTYYKECPICKTLGQKSITHIKQCANKKGIDPKKLVQLLSKCPKSDHPVEFPKKKPNAKHAKKKVVDNYVISFGAQKQMKIAIDHKMTGNKNIKQTQSKYQLLSLDPMERQRLLMSKINERMLCEQTEYYYKSDNLLNSFCILPDIWSLSLLDSDSDKYFVEGFKKYNKL